MDVKNVRKLTLIINTLILFLVFGLAGFFYMCKATYLVWFSIPTALIYILGYFIIFVDRLDIYVRLVYLWITFYMSLTTICLGYKMGFHLYCLSMIPIIFCTEYIAEQIGKKKINAFAVSAVVVVCYLSSTGFVAFVGPIYEVDNRLAGLFWIFNSAIVLSFLIIYAGFMLKMVRNSENKLTVIAHTDKLTGLNNRHFMMKRLEESVKENDEKYIAMIDIDDFKKINDAYGHNTGDYVLSTISEIMKTTCKDSVISRWGGEEFLVMSEGAVNKDGLSLFESLRKNVENKDFVFEGNSFKVTITIGLSDHVKDRSVDQWINEADEKLYQGKNSGKNKVVV